MDRRLECNTFSPR